MVVVENGRGLVLRAYQMGAMMAKWIARRHCDHLWFCRPFLIGAALIGAAILASAFPSCRVWTIAYNAAKFSGFLN